jgi:endonuclease/exonuclease/phosphatase family metal-dependent hydrolase
MIGGYLASRADASVPVVIAGDFNTYGTDTAEISSRLDAVAEGLERVTLNGNYTWRSTSQGQTFDHLWVSRGVPVSNAHVAGPCNSSSRSSISRYNAQVSDHCPVTLTLGLAAAHP